VTADHDAGDFNRAVSYSACDNYT